MSTKIPPTTTSSQSAKPLELTPQPKAPTLAEQVQRNIDGAVAEQPMTEKFRAILSQGSAQPPATPSGGPTQSNGAVVLGLTVIPFDEVSGKIGAPIVGVGAGVLVDGEKASEIVGGGGGIDYGRPGSWKSPRETHAGGQLGKPLQPASEWIDALFPKRSVTPISTELGAQNPANKTGDRGTGDRFDPLNLDGKETNNNDRTDRGGGAGGGESKDASETRGGRPDDHGGGATQVPRGGSGDSGSGGGSDSGGGDKKGGSSDAPKFIERKEGAGKGGGDPDPVDHSRDGVRVQYTRDPPPRKPKDPAPDDDGSVIANRLPYDPLRTPSWWKGTELEPRSVDRSKSPESTPGGLSDDRAVNPRPNGTPELEENVALRKSKLPVDPTGDEVSPSAHAKAGYVLAHDRSKPAVELSRPKETNSGGGSPGELGPRRVPVAR